MIYANLKKILFREKRVKSFENGKGERWRGVMLTVHSIGLIPNFALNLWEYIFEGFTNVL